MTASEATIESFIDPDCPCTDPDCIISESRTAQGRYFTRRDFEKRKARVLLRPMPGGTTLEDIRYFFSRDSIDSRYKLMMFALEEKAPGVYRALRSLGFPEPCKPNETLYQYL